MIALISSFLCLYAADPTSRLFGLFFLAVLLLSALSVVIRKTTCWRGMNLSKLPQGITVFIAVGVLVCIVFARWGLLVFNSVFSSIPFCIVVGLFIIWLIQDCARTGVIGDTVSSGQG
jgi:hypothetical protein